MTTCRKIIVLSSTVALMMALTVSNQTHEQEPVVDRIARYIGSENDDVDPERLEGIARSVLEESKRHGIDYRLVLAVMKVESNFRHTVVSSRGARGLLQVKPSLAKHIAEDAGVEWRGAKTLDDPNKNVKIGVHFLANLIDDFEHLHLALQAYNVGPTRLKQILTQKNNPRSGFARSVFAEYEIICSVLPAA
jgi:soluble lytic murein transglycosylase